MTFGTQYDDHPVLFSDRRHVLYSEFNGATFPPVDGARLIRLDLVTGTREVYAVEEGCALHHATLSATDNRLVYHHDCGDRRSQRVGWGPGSYAATPLAERIGISFRREIAHFTCNRGKPFVLSSSIKVRISVRHRKAPK